MIQNAQEEILATMDLAEELAKPLPEEYFSLLKDSASKGIRITRVAFGSFADFQKFLTNHADQAQYSVLSGSSDYRRMLLVDNSILMYASGVKEKRFFHTGDPEVIQKFKDYFLSLLKS